MTLSAEKLKELLGKVERATGPDREIDRELAELAGLNPFYGYLGQYWLEEPSFGADATLASSGEECPYYTADLNAALGLADLCLPAGYLWSVGRPPDSGKKRKRKSDNARIPFDGYIATDDRIGAKSHHFALVEHVSPSLALVAAILYSPPQIPGEPEWLRRNG